MRIVIDGTPWAGEWELADFFFTNRELHRIKQISGGVRAGELLDALEANDTAAFVGVAVVAIERAGKRPDPDDLWDAPVGSITLNLDDVVADADPLDEQPGNGRNESSVSSTHGSGSGSDS